MHTEVVVRVLGEAAQRTAGPLLVVLVKLLRLRLLLGRRRMQHSTGGGRLSVLMLILAICTVYIGVDRGGHIIHHAHIGRGTASGASRPTTTIRSGVPQVEAQSKAVELLLLLTVFRFCTCFRIRCAHRGDALKVALISDLSQSDALC